MCFSCPDPELTESSRIGVVGEGDRKPEFVFKAFNDWEVVPMGVVWGFDQKSIRDVLAARSTKAGSHNGVFADPNTIEQFFRSLCDTLHGVDGTASLKRVDGCKTQRLTLIVQQTDFYPSAADVDAEEVGGNRTLERANWLRSHVGLMFLLVA
jgi:hypothetical protein